MVMTFFTSMCTFWTSASGFCVAGALAVSERKAASMPLCTGQGIVFLCVSLESAVVHRQNETLLMHCCQRH